MTKDENLSWKRSPVDHPGYQLKSKNLEKLDDFKVKSKFKFRF
jgi:hypothetical protein